MDLLQTAFREDLLVLLFGDFKSACSQVTCPGREEIFLLPRYLLVLYLWAGLSVFIFRMELRGESRSMKHVLQDRGLCPPPGSAAALGGLLAGPGPWGGWLERSRFFNLW